MDGEQHDSIEERRAGRSAGRSLDPMLLVDDDRRCVDANAAACLFLRQRVEVVRTLTIDDLTAPQLRSRVAAKWNLLLQGKAAVDELAGELRMPDATTVAVSLSITPHVGRGRHLATIGFPAARAPGDCLVGAAAPARKLLTEREREVLTRVALGDTGVDIARRLFLSPATVQTHVANALIKLGARNRAHGVALAVEHNELEPDLQASIMRGAAASVRRVGRAA